MNKHILIIFTGSVVARYKATTKHDKPLLIDLLAPWIAQRAHHIYSVTEKKWLKLRADKSEVMLHAVENMINFTWHTLPEARIVIGDTTHDVSLVVDDFSCDYHKDEKNMETQKKFLT